VHRLVVNTALLFILNTPYFIRIEDRQLFEKLREHDGNDALPQLFNKMVKLKGR
jgi:hypothetical protein